MVDPISLPKSQQIAIHHQTNGYKAPFPHAMGKGRGIGERKSRITLATEVKLPASG
jgi:hypothetical protein